MIPLVVKARSRGEVQIELAKRGLHSDKITPLASFPHEFYAEVPDQAHSAVARWFLETAPAENCPWGGLLFYRYGDDA